MSHCRYNGGFSDFVTAWAFGSLISLTLAPSIVLLILTNTSSGPRNCNLSPSPESQHFQDVCNKIMFEKGKYDRFKK